MRNIILYGLVLHLAFFASIFVIFFESPIIEGLTPQTDLPNPPAHRLVLFIADGLRAESFFRDSCERTPFLRNIILNEGIHGVSHTHVPTESRPGHVALIAGIYEDPSAVLKGWQENPVDFDSVFNRSQVTYSFGSPDVVSIFSKGADTKRIHTFTYDPSNEDFSGERSTILLDTWVFDRVSDFLKENKNQLRSRRKMILFLHLLGLDTAGHVHKPNTKLFDDNLSVVDSGIEKVVQEIEQLFDDQRTAYIFTSDHGMTDRGSHGSGNNYETETPVVAWGSGISTTKQLPTVRSSSYTKINERTVPRFDMEQADIAPLMASLIGVAVPVNNFGRLPVHYMNVSKDYQSRAALNNALQVAAQYKYLYKEFQHGFFSGWLPNYDELSADICLKYERGIDKAIVTERYDKAIYLSMKYYQLALDGLEYYQTYYQYVLLLSVSLSMYGWIFYLYDLITVTGTVDANWKLDLNRKFIFASVAIIALIFIYLQCIKIKVALFFLLPIICWYPVRLYSIYKLIQNVKVWLLIGATQFLVLSFFYRYYLSILLIVILILTRPNFKKGFNSPHGKWFIVTLILCVFPLLPEVGKDSSNILLLSIGIFSWGIKLTVDLVNQLNQQTIMNLSLYMIQAINIIVTIFNLNQGNGLTIPNQLISSICLGLSFIVPLFGERTINDRLRGIINGLCIPYLTMSLSYEPILLLLFSLSLFYWIEMELDRSDMRNEGKLMFNRKDIGISNNQPDRKIMDLDFDSGFRAILYILISFFGTGSIASVSSFDPNWVRCLVATFSPFLMSGLIIIKLLIPIILVICTLRAISITSKIRIEKLFTIMLFLCDWMCLTFLFLVKNKGSWLDIGTSISHFVIMEATVLVLYLLQILAVILTNVELPVFSKRKLRFVGDFIGIKIE